MNPHSIPPLLRGIGVTTILAGALIGLLQADGTVDAHVPSTPSKAVAQSRPEAELNALSAEIEKLREELQDESIAEELLENPWFEWLGLLGSGFIEFSFYTEWFIRKDE